MNRFDIAVYAGLAIAVVTGFNIGLLRSAITILGYLIAAPMAVLAMSAIAQQIGGPGTSPLTQNWGLFFGAYLAIGIGIAKLMRITLDETIGSEAGLGDRFAGAALGALRVGLVATTVVLIFDQLVPVDRQPAFLNGSQLRPIFSAVGQKGFKSLPPEVATTIDRLKKEQRI
jgi:membrane protein required for colicin V production